MTEYDSTQPVQQRSATQQRRMDERLDALFAKVQPDDEQQARDAHNAAVDRRKADKRAKVARRKQAKRQAKRFGA